MGCNDEQTANCNNEPTKLEATVCAEQATKYNDEIRGRTDRQAMMRNDNGSSPTREGRRGVHRFDRQKMRRETIGRATTN